MSIAGTGNVPHRSFVLVRILTIHQSIWPASRSFLRCQEHKTVQCEEREADRVRLIGFSDPGHQDVAGAESNRLKISLRSMALAAALPTCIAGQHDVHSCSSNHIPWLSWCAAIDQPNRALGVRAPELDGVDKRGTQADARNGLS